MSIFDSNQSFFEKSNFNMKETHEGITRKNHTRETHIQLLIVTYQHHY